MKDNFEGSHTWQVNASYKGKGRWTLLFLVQIKAHLMSPKVKLSKGRLHIS